MTLSIATGYSTRYLTDQVAVGRENYYTGAVSAGEPPGRWSGAGAEKLGLTGLVDAQDMQAVYEFFVDPRDEHFGTPERWGEASTLGHTGRAYKTAEQLYAAALNAEPDADAERREQLRLDAGRRASQKNVPFLDATFSVQKSVTVLHTSFNAQEAAARRTLDALTESASDTDQVAAQTAVEAWAAHRTAVEDAIWAGNQAGLAYLSEKAGYSRIGHHGGSAGRWIDAHDWTVASFFQHDSRNHDPQLHIHNAILNRVEGADGQWRTLDSRAIHKFRGAAAAVAERTTEAHLTQALGVRFATRPDGKAREVVGIEQNVMDLFSSRRRAITRHTETLVAEYREKFGREPNSLELDRLQRQATFATRASKTHEGETADARLDRWDRQLRAEVAGGLKQVADDALAARPEKVEPATWSAKEVVETALADVQSKKAGWTAPDLTRAISDALPDTLGPLDGASMARLLDTLTSYGLKSAVPLDAPRPGDDVLPEDFKLVNGTSSFQKPGGRRYATADHIHTERNLVAATARRGAPTMTGEQVTQFTTSFAELGKELGADQAAAVRGVLTSGHAVESLVGPAGTGKSFVVGAVAKAWQDPDLWGGQQRRVVGLASSQIATNVLAGEDVAARNITRWLNTQQRIESGRMVADDAEWRLRAGDLVVVDESAMADTTALSAIWRHVKAAGAKLLLTGDHKQLAAVGAGGGMELMAEAGARYELVEARRFSDEWERGASLRLRDGDRTVLGEYHRHGRLLDGGTLEQVEASAARAWLGDTLAGDNTLLIVDSNEQAARLSGELRAQLVRLGRVEEHGVPLNLQGTYAGKGDLVQARLNGWNLAGYHGNRGCPINREQYRVLETSADGGLVVAPILGREPHAEDPAGGMREVLGDRLTLPASYVSEHVALVYASTVHAAQGVTVDRCHTVVTPATNLNALYVGMSRGKHGNTAHVTTVTVDPDQPTGATLDAIHRSPAAVLADTFDTAEQTADASASAAAADSAAEVEAIGTPLEMLAAAVETTTAGRTARWLDELVAAGALTAVQRERIAAEDGAATLTKLLRRAELAGHNPHAVLNAAVRGRDLAGARQLTNVIHHRITDTVTLDPTTGSYRDWVPKVTDPQNATYLDTLAAAADQRRHQLGEQAATDPPRWATEAIGPVPTDSRARTDWVKAAGTVAAHRELTGHDDPATAIGAAPKPGQAEVFASWRAAWQALGRPEAARDEMEMTTGQLRLRVRAHEREAAWAPPYVGEELAGTRQATDRHRHTAELRRAEAEAAAAARDVERQQQKEREAHEASELAAALDARAADLQTTDDARAEWSAHTAATRAARDRAVAELATRDANEAAAVAVQVTAEEWLAAHDAEQRDADQHRDITTEADLTDEVDQRRRAAEAVEPTPHRDATETAVPDVRDTAAEETPRVEHDELHVPTADETADAVERARRALREMEQRDAEEAAQIEHERAEQLAHWHAQDQATEAEQTAQQAAAWEAEPVLEVDEVGR